MTVAQSNSCIRSIYACMKNIDQWKPNRIEWNGERFVPSMRVVYPGSLHIADLQIRAYEPLIRKYIQGDILDCACGSVPYYALYKDQISSSTCIDWEGTHGSNPFFGSGSRFE